jgi:hypothetical protein
MGRHGIQGLVIREGGEGMVSSIGLDEVSSKGLAWFQAVLLIRTRIRTFFAGSGIYNYLCIKKPVHFWKFFI